MSEKDLLQLQVGRETVFGTSVAATAKLMGVVDATFREMPVVERIEDIRGSLAPSYAAVLKYVSAEGHAEMKMSYEDIHLFEMLFGDVAPSGAGPYVHAYS